MSLNSENGLKNLLDKIKSLYAKDIHSLAYMAKDTFETFHRPAEMSIVGVLTTGVLVNRALKHANITLEKQQLVHTTLTLLTYESMKKQFNVIYDSSFESATSTSGIKKVFFSKSDGNYYCNKKRDFKQQNSWGHQRDRSGKYQKESNCYWKDGMSKVVN